MHPTEIESCLDRMIVLTDSREHDTDKFRRRMDEFGAWERATLYYGDYTAKTVRNDGTEITLEGKVHIERKSGLSEIIGNFCESALDSPYVQEWNVNHPKEKIRNRFEWELKRAQLAGARIYLVVENATWEHIYGHKFESRMNEKAVIATILAYQARYHLTVLFVNDRLAGRFIKDILRYEMREELKKYE